MARADLLLDLVEAERRGDRDRFRVLIEAVIAEERANQHHLLADRLSELISTTGQRAPRDDRAAAIRDLVQEVVPQRRLDELELATVRGESSPNWSRNSSGATCCGRTGLSRASGCFSPGRRATARPASRRH